MNNFTGAAQRPAVISITSLLLVLLPLGRGAKAWADFVTIVKEPADIKTRVFDPDNPPADRPKIEGDEAGLTVSNFNIDTNVSTEVVRMDDTHAGKVSVTLRIINVKMTLKMAVTMWLPTDCPEKLKAHEEGHHQVSEHYYKDAEKTARELAKTVAGKTVSGEGANLEQAARAAAASLVDKIDQQYITRVEGTMAKVQSVYDELTEHGTNDLPEDQAIAQAIERVTRELATTQSGIGSKPSTRP